MFGKLEKQNKDTKIIDIEIINIAMINENHYSLTVKHELLTCVGVKATREEVTKPWKLLLEWGRQEPESLRIKLSEKFKAELEKSILMAFIPAELNLVRTRKQQALKSEIIDNERRLEKLID
jgi:hypothetical protein